MQVTPEIRDRVLQKIQDCITLIQFNYNVVVKMPIVTFDKRGSTAGTANYKTWHIKFNPILLMQNIDDFITRTVPHELAHLACEIIYPEAHHPRTISSFSFRPRRVKRDVHGPRWQSIMRKLGADPSRCHNYDLSDVKHKKTSYTYACVRCSKQFTLGPKRHSKLIHNPTAYHCRCRGKLELKSIVKPINVAGVLKGFDKLMTIAGGLKPLTIMIPAKLNLLAKGTKIAQCYTLYQQWRSYSRKELINVFVQEVGISVACATTYYYTCHKMYNV